MNIAETTMTPSGDDATTQGAEKLNTLLWQKIVLAAILLLAAFLNLYQLAQNGFADTNTYYAAAVKSMLLNWHNFFFAAFDPAGFLSIDKPPLGFWAERLEFAVTRSAGRYRFGCLALRAGATGVRCERRAAGRAGPGGHTDQCGDQPRQHHR